MADLEIAPTTHSMVSPTPSYPSTAPVQEEIARSGEVFQREIERASVLIAAASRFNQEQKGAEAYIDLKSGLANLHERLDKVHDLDIKQQQYDKERANLVNNVRKQYPNLSPTQMKSLVSMVDDDRRTFHSKLAAQGIINARRDLSKLYDSSLRLAAMSTSTKDREGIAVNYYNQLDRAQGILSPDEIKDLKVKFGLNLKREQFAALAASKPEEILMLHPEDAVSKYGILPTDLLKYQNTASQIISNKHNTAEANLKGTQEQNLEWAWQHPNEVGRIQELGRTNQLPGGMSTADQITGTIGDKFPPNPGLTQGIINQLIHYPGGPLAFKTWFNEHIRPQMYHMNSNDISQINGMYNTESGERTSDLKVKAKDMLNDIYVDQHRLMGEDGYGVNLFSGKIRIDTTQRNEDVIRQATARFNAAKDIHELSEIRDYFLKQQDEWYKKTWGTTPKTTTTPAPEGGDIKRE